MDSWRVAILGDNDVGKTAFAVQVCYRFPAAAREFLSSLILTFL
jgi:hypothetical protein